MSKQGHAIISKALLPKPGLNRQFHCIWRHTLFMFQGLNMPQPFHVQGQEQFKWLQLAGLNDGIDPSLQHVLHRVLLCRSAFGVCVLLLMVMFCFSSLRFASPRHVLLLVATFCFSFSCFASPCHASLLFIAFCFAFRFSLSRFGFTSVNRE
jgi:hypothetical protein